MKSYDVEAYVSCREYDGTLMSAQPAGCESRWHRGTGVFALDLVGQIRGFLFPEAWGREKRNGGTVLSIFGRGKAV